MQLSAVSRQLSAFHFCVEVRASSFSKLDTCHLETLAPAR